MRFSRLLVVPATALLLATTILLYAFEPKTPPKVITGQAAFHDFSQEKPGTFRKITVADLPQPYETKSAFRWRKSCHVLRERGRRRCRDSRSSFTLPVSTIRG